MPFFVESLGGDASTLGLLFSTFAVCQMFATSWMGLLSDKIGRRPIMLLSLGGSTIGMLASSLAPNIATLFAARAFLGSLSGSMSAATAYIAEITTPAERPRLMSISGIIMQLSFMFGPGVGAGLSQLNIRAPFYVGAFTSAAAFAVALFNIKTPAEIEASDELLAASSQKTDVETSAALLPKGDQDKPKPAADEAPAESAPTNWPLILLTGSGSLFTNFAMSSAMTCGALFLQVRAPSTRPCTGARRTHLSAASARSSCTALSAPRRPPSLAALAGHPLQTALRAPRSPLTRAHACRRTSSGMARCSSASS